MLEKAAGRNKIMISDVRGAILAFKNRQTARVAVGLFYTGYRLSLSNVQGVPLYGCGQRQVLSECKLNILT